MKITILDILALFLFGCHQNKIPDGKFILSKTIIEQDTLNDWNNTKLNIHIQEPRIANP